MREEYQIAISLSSAFFFIGKALVGRRGKSQFHRVYLMNFSSGFMHGSVGGGGGGESKHFFFRENRERAEEMNKDQRNSGTMDNHNRRRDG